MPRIRRRRHHYKSRGTGHYITVKMLFSAISLLSGLLAVNALALEERATGGYVQNPSGAASFTMYTGCGSPGMRLSPTGFLSIAGIG